LAYPLKGKRPGDRCGARTGKDDRRARHTLVEAARRALNYFAERLADKVRARIATCHEVGGGIT
jgi:hypothetical protein